MNKQEQLQSIETKMNKLMELMKDEKKQGHYLTLYLIYKEKAEVLKKELNQ